MNLSYLVHNPCLHNIGRCLKPTNNDLNVEITETVAAARPKVARYIAG